MNLISLNSHFITFIFVQVAEFRSDNQLLADWLYQSLDPCTLQYNQKEMSNHLIKSLVSNTLAPFPSRKRYQAVLTGTSSYGK